jgi:hypothetical protein
MSTHCAQRNLKSTPNFFFFFFGTEGETQGFVHVSNSTTELHLQPLPSNIYLLTELPCKGHLL